MSFAFNIPFQVVKGEAMKTVKVTIANASTNMYAWAVEIERLAADAGVKNGIVWYSDTTETRYNLPVACTIVNGLVMGKNNSTSSGSNWASAYRYRSGAILAVLGSNYDADSRVGDEYTIAVVDCPWFE